MYCKNNNCIYWADNACKMRELTPAGQSDDPSYLYLKMEEAMLKQNKDVLPPSYKQEDAI